MDTVSTIESTKCDKLDRPLEEIKLLSIDILLE